MRRRGLAAFGGAMLVRVATRPAGAADITAECARIETAVGGRLGVAVIATGSGARLMYRADERFPMCSTFKVLASGAILARVDAGAERLDRRIPFTAADLVSYSPVTKHYAGAGMPLEEICAAAITMSDNTAGNLMLASLGGPEAVTQFARALGDAVTRLDRTETALNEATPGDPRDTTTPAAMANDLRMLVLGDVLSKPSRAQLAAWLRATKTGDAKLRAGVPATWSVGDKTGGGDHGTVNDVAVLWPPSHPPLVACVYMTETSAGFDRCNAAIAAVGRVIRGSLMS